MATSYQRLGHSEIPIYPKKFHSIQQAFDAYVEVTDNG